MMLSGENKGKEVSIVRIDIQDEFLDIGNGARYRINDSGGSIAQYLKQNMGFIKREIGREVSGKEIEGFLNELVFVVNLPNEDQLREFFKGKLSSRLAERFGYIGGNEIFCNDLLKKISDWVKDIRGRFFSRKEGEGLFREVELWASTLGRIERGVKILVNGQQACKEPIWFNMMEPVASFTGRSNELKALHDALQRSAGKQAVISQVASISGLGGIGKSELARKYAYSYEEYYDGNAIWINAENFEGMRNSFLDLANNRLSVSPKDEYGNDKTIETIVREVYAFFARRGRKSLFIFDNVEGYKGIERFLPSSLHPRHKRPYVLITSRDRKWKVRGEGDIEVIQLDEFGEVEALEFVKKALNIENNWQDREIEELTKELQYFPLALGQAVAYIYNKNEELAPYGKFEISDYLEKFKHQAEKLFEETESLLKKWLYDEEEENEEEYSKRVRYTKTVLTTWNVTIEAIEQKECSTEALNVLEIMAYLAPDRIRVQETFLELIVCDKTKLWDVLELLDKYPMTELKGREASVQIPTELKLQVDEIFLQLVENSKKKLWDAVKLLDRYSMIDLIGGVASIHRLVQKVTELKLKKEGREEEVLRKAIKLLNADYIFDDSVVASVWGYASKHDKLIDSFYLNFTYSTQKYTPLYSLAKSGDYGAVKRILTRIEDAHLGRLNCVVNAKSEGCITPLHSAAYGGKLDMLKYLISKGADINSDDSTPLHFAVLGQNLRVVEHLISKGAYINAQDNDGRTPLHFSALCESCDITEYLIEKGADVNAKNKDGSTSLHFAVTMKNVNVVKVLLEHNADINVKNNKGITALHYATDFDHRGLVELLLAHGTVPY